MPADVVLSMMDAYKAAWLGYMWLVSSEVGQSVLPGIELRPLSASVLNMQVKMKSISDMQYEIAEVCQDDVIEKHEKPIWDKGTKVITGLISSLFSVLLAPKEKSPALERRRQVV